MSKIEYKWHECVVSGMGSFVRAWRCDLSVTGACGSGWLRLLGLSLFCCQKVPGERLTGEIQCSLLLSTSPTDIYSEQVGLLNHANLFQIYKIK